MKFDLIIVDGPFGGSTPYARFSAIPFLENNIADDFSVFIDDVSRAQENEISLEWQKILSATLKNYGRYAHLSNKILFDATPFGNNS